MSVIGNPLLLSPEGYQIERSVRLRSSASAYLNRTFSSGANETTSTLSLWVKRGKIGAQQTLMGVAGGGSNEADLFFDGGDTLTFASWNGGSRPLGIITTSAVYRDPSAWYHIVFVVNTTTATANDRLVLYVNGVRQALSVNTQPSQNAVWYWNGAYAHRLGAYANTLGVYLDGYLTDINFIDGQALTPSSFGENDAITGVWKPKKYAGTYGTNGFYLNFSDNSAATAAAIGKDYSGNGNNWTPNNISVTAGVTYDSMLDVPTLWADGGNGRGNYCVMSPINSASGIAISNANLRLSNSTNGGIRSNGSIGVSSGKWYFEVTDTTAGTFSIVGIGQNNLTATDVGTDSLSYGWYLEYAQKVNNASSSAYGTALTSGDVCMVAFDLDNNKVFFGKNGTWFNSSDPAAGTSPAYTITAGTYNAVARPYGSSTAVMDMNFGQRPFAYTPPTGFKALNTQNLPEPTIKKGNAYFDVSLYTGNGTSQSIVNGGGFQPDLVWVKERSGTRDHRLVDSVRGVGKEIYSSLTFAEATDAAGLTSFNSNGYSIGSSVGYNANGVTQVGWQWKESPSAGFDIVTYTGTGVARTVAHSLGVKPSMMIVKNRSSGTTGWAAYHSALGATKVLELNTTSAAVTASGEWNNTEPTSSVFTVGTSSWTNNNTNSIVAYLFSEVAGFSKFGSYTGNGSADGPFVFCGFRPKFVMIKRTDTTNFWLMMDTTRNTYNVMGDGLLANTSGAEFGWNPSKDILSNGFKVRTSDAAENASGGTYIFMAFAESPFKNSLAR